MDAWKSEIRDGMHIDWDMPIVMDDGLVLRADIFRPIHEGKFPVILSYGPYGKGLAFQEGYKTAWEIMERENPDVMRGSTNKYQNWEVVDPEKWVPDEYVCIRIDSRVAASLLHDIGMSELTCTSFDEYHDKALLLATDSSERSKTKSKLAGILDRQSWPPTPKQQAKALEDLILDI